MSDLIPLAQAHCTPRRGQDHRLGEARIAELLPQIPGWELAEDGRALWRHHVGGAIRSIAPAPDGHTLAVGKAAYYRQAELPLDEAYAYAKGVMVHNLQARDAREGIDAFIDKRHPTWCHG